MDHITSFQIEATPERIEAVFERLRSGTEQAPAYLCAEAADSWSFSFWRGLDKPILRYRGGESVDADCVPREWLPGSMAGLWFDVERQLSWRRMLIDDKTMFRMVLMDHDLALSETIASITHITVLERTTTEQLALARNKPPEQFILWGQQTANTPGEWLDLSIPHRFRYPWHTASDVSGPRNVAIEAIRWFDDVGRTHFVRYTRVVPVDSSDIIEEEDDDETPKPDELGIPEHEVNDA